MPVIVSAKHDRIAELIGELVDKIDEHISTPPEPPVVNVDVAAPSASVIPAPVVNVSTPAPKASHPWLFTVARDDEGRIKTITATPKT